MRIISSPQNRINCGHCRTVFEYDDSDIKKKIEPPGYDEYDNREVYSVSCPVCSTKHHVNASSYQKSKVNSRRDDDDMTY